MRSGLRPVLATLLMIAASAVAGPTAADPGNGHDPHPTDYDYVFAWTAPADHEGDLFIELDIDYGPSNDCLLRHAAAGERNTTSLLRATTMGQSWSTSAGGHLATHTARAHAGTIDTRDVTDHSSFRWASTTTFLGPVAGSQPSLLAAFGTRTVTIAEEAFPGFEIAIGCRAPFTIASTSASRHVLGFTQASMEGAGASAKGPIGPQASANLHGHAGAAFAHEQVRFAARGFQMHGAAEGTMDLHHPHGTNRYALSGFFVEFDHRGGPGAYEVDVTRVAAGVAEVFWGVIGGLERVDHLDEVVA